MDFTATGEVGDVNASDIAQGLAAALSVPSEAISLRVVAASVRIETVATVSTAAASQVVRAARKIDATSASALIGLPVETVALHVQLSSGTYRYSQVLVAPSPPNPLAPASAPPLAPPPSLPWVSVSSPRATVPFTPPTRTPTTPSPPSLPIVLQTDLVKDAQEELATSGGSTSTISISIGVGIGIAGIIACVLCGMCTNRKYAQRGRLASRRSRTRGDDAKKLDSYGRMPAGFGRLFRQETGRGVVVGIAPRAPEPAHATATADFATSTRTTDAFTFASIAAASKRLSTPFRKQSGKQPNTTAKTVETPQTFDPSEVASVSSTATSPPVSLGSRGPGSMLLTSSCIEAVLDETIAAQSAADVPETVGHSAELVAPESPSRPSSHTIDESSPLGRARKAVKARRVSREARFESRGAQLAWLNAQEDSMSPQQRDSNDSPTKEVDGIRRVPLWSKARRGLALQSLRKDATYKGAWV